MTASLSEGPSPKGAGWWVHDGEGRCAARPHLGADLVCISSRYQRATPPPLDGRFVVIDPLSAQLSPQFHPLHNQLPVLLPTPSADASELACTDVAVAPHIGAATAQLGSLSALLRARRPSQRRLSCISAESGRWPPRRACSPRATQCRSTTSGSTSAETTAPLCGIYSSDHAAAPSFASPSLHSYSTPPT